MFQLNKVKNYYEILEVPASASPEEIKQAYIRVKNAYAEDSLALYSLVSKDECNEMLSLIDEAYGIICDPNKRAAYDHARGIVNHKVDASPEKNNFGRHQLNTNLGSNQFSHDTLMPKNTNSNIAKIVANNKFSLEFEIDTDLEQEIESTNEFTGAFLKKIREYKNVDIKRMSEMTKVSKTYLLKIESEDFSSLPATAYVRGFVYQFAKCLKLNPNLVATSYIFRMKQLKGEN